MNRPARSSWTKRILKVAGTLAVVALIAAAGVYYLLHPMLRAVPEPEFAAPASLAEANQQDLEYLRLYGRFTRSFGPEALAALDAAIDDLAANAASLDAAALEMGISRAVALADDAHSNVQGAGFGLSLNSVPLRLARFAEGVFVISADPALTNLVGNRVAEVEGLAPEDLTKALAPFVGGPESFRRERALQFMVSPASLHAAGLAAAPDALRLVVEAEDGTKVERSIAAVSTPANGPVLADPGENGLRERFSPHRALSPVRAAWDPRPWVHVLDGAGEPPLYLAQPDTYYWNAPLPEMKALFVQINAVRDQGGEATLEAFLEETVAEVGSLGVQNVIVDLRFNSGGNYEKTVAFTKALPQALPEDGRIFVLTSGNTFSAAIVTAARLAYFGGDRVQIVGERIGDREAHWGEVRDFELPNSGLILQRTTAWHNWGEGCGMADLRRCFLLNYVWGVAAGDLSPDIPAQVRFADYKSGRDTALVAVEEWLKASVTP
jgi:hypothetical protein